MQTGIKSCSRCGAPFTCGLAAGETSCWCAQLPRVMPVKEVTSDCLCRSCLQREINTRLASQPCDDDASA